MNEPAPEERRLQEAAFLGPSALPSTGARVLAFGAILVAGVCGGLIGFAVADLQCTGSCTAISGLAALVGAVLGAGGVAVIAVLVLRAMSEWRADNPVDDPPPTA